MRAAHWVGWGVAIAALGCGGAADKTPVASDAAGVEDVGVADAAGTDAVGSDDAEVDAAAVDVDVGPCQPGFVVDGRNTGWQAGPGCGEYPQAGAVIGGSGTYYAGQPATAAMQLLIDWTSRSDAGLCGSMFSRLRFSTGSGKQHWRWQVFADQHNTLTRNGVAWTGAHQAKYTLEGSAQEQKPHPQFEVRLDGVAVGQVAILVQAPDTAAHLTQDPGTPPGCALPDAALVEEPVVLVAQMSAKGLSPLAKAQGIIAVTVDKPVTAIGETLTVWGAGFGTAPGTVKFNEQDAQIVDWKPGAIRVQVPITQQIEGKIVVQSADGQVSTPIFVALHNPPDPSQCVGKDPASPCDDGWSCTTNDVCKAGKCVGTDQCVASQPCMASACGTGSDCVETPLAVGAPCHAAGCKGFCDAGGVCKVADGDLACDDKDTCSQETCNAYGCSHVALVDATACDDGQSCTTSDACKGGVCTGAAVNCDDGSACTLDQCDAIKGCIHPTVCDDGNPCTIDSCKNGQCATENLADTTGCDDLNPCTTNTHCQSGKCVGQAVPGCK